MTASWPSRVAVAAIVAVGALGAAPVGSFSAAAAPPAPQLTSADQEFARLASGLERRGYSFDRIFSALCQTALDRADRNPALALGDQVRAVFGGLWLWGMNGGHPALQGREDWALHFLGGGAFEGYWDAGYTAGLIKEQIDSRTPGNVFDLDDLAATMLGARWIQVATAGSADQTRRWTRRWADGEWTLARSLPPLRFGPLPAHTQAPPQTVRELRAYVARALPAMADAALTDDKPAGPQAAPRRKTE